LFFTRSLPFLPLHLLFLFHHTPSPPPPLIPPFFLLFLSHHLLSAIIPFPFLPLQCSKSHSCAFRIRKVKDSYKTITRLSDCIVRMRARWIINFITESPKINTRMSILWNADLYIDRSPKLVLFIKQQVKMDDMEERVGEISRKTWREKTVWKTRRRW
jgi:hypothetical protein